MKNAPSILDQIQCPKDLKTLAPEQIELLAEETNTDGSL